MGLIGALLGRKQAAKSILYMKIMFNEMLNEKVPENAIEEADSALTLINGASSGGFPMNRARKQLGMHLEKFAQSVDMDHAKITLGFMAMLNDCCDMSTKEMKPILGMGWAKEVIVEYHRKYCPEEYC